MTATAEAPSRNGNGPKRDAVQYREAVKASMKRYEVDFGGRRQRVPPKEKEVDQFLLECQLLGLEPLAGQVYAVWENGSVRAVPTIDGMRLLAERTGLYEGQSDPEWCDAEGVWTDYWLADDHPTAARVRVHRKGAKVPTTGTANWHDFAPQGGTGADALWDQQSGKPAHMLSIRAEALALRKAFPAQLSGLYTAEELGISLGAIGGVAEEPSASPDVIARDVPPGPAVPPAPDSLRPAPAPLPPAIPTEAGSVPQAAPEDEGPSVIVDDAGEQPSGPPARPAARRTLAEALASADCERLRGELTEALFDQMPDRLTDEQSEILASALADGERAGVTPVELERACKVARRDGEGNVAARAQALLEWISERRQKAEAEATASLTASPSEASAAPNPSTEGGEGPSQAPSLLDADPGPEVAP